MQSELEGSEVALEGVEAEEGACHSFLAPLASSFQVPKLLPKCLNALSIHSFIHFQLRQHVPHTPNTYTHSTTSLQWQEATMQVRDTIHAAPLVSHLVSQLGVPDANTPGCPGTPRKQMGGPPTPRSSFPGGPAFHATARTSMQQPPRVWLVSQVLEVGQGKP
jgi:hypothetical protein